MSRIAFIIVLAGFLGSGGSAALAEVSIERGDYLVNSIAGCGNCHTPIGPNGMDETQALGGRLVEDVEAFTAIAPNITPGGRVAEWTDEELARAIREGVRPDGSVIGLPMPFDVYRLISDDDLRSMVAYLRTVPALDSDPGESEYRIPLPPAWGPPVEHVAAVPEGVTVAYGQYLAGPLGHCISCHTPRGPQGNLYDTALGAGGNEFHGPWGVSIAPNITPAGIGGYTDEELITMISTGVRPDGTPMLPPMGYAFYSRMTEDDLRAIVLYLRALPPITALAPQ